MPGERILIVEDELQFGATLRQFLMSKGFAVLSARTCSEGEYLCRSEHPDAVILDYELPDGDGLRLMERFRAIDATLPVIFLTGQGSIRLAVDAIKEGADQFLTKPTDLSALWIILKRCLENRETRQSGLAYKVSTSRNIPDPFAGKSECIRRLAERAARVLNTSSPVLIEGETGTGKGVLAQWLHNNGSRAGRPFLNLNCGGLSREFLETELFGHEKGAFTGAIQNKPGLLELGHKGTVFLDEIGDADGQVQIKLLKVVEEKIFRRLGDVREKRVDIRLIVATHRKLRELIADRRFREDLYFRISTIALDIPPLRDRIEDIPILARQLLDHISTELGIGPIEISSDAMEYLQTYSWPGNVRELRNILERGVILGNQKGLTARDLHFEIENDLSKSGHSQIQIKTMKDIERDHIAEVLTIVGGRVNDAAKSLGIPRSSLYFKIKEYGLVSNGRRILAD
jgi:DNA-binding NtrC family response regulator